MSIKQPFTLPKLPVFVPLDATAVPCASCTTELQATPAWIQKYTIFCTDCAQKHWPNGKSAVVDSILNSVFAILTGKQSKLPIPSWAEIIERFGLCTARFESLSKS